MAIDGTDFECPGSDHIVRVPRYCSMCDKHFCKACKHSCDENYKQNPSKFLVKKLQRFGEGIYFIEIKVGMVLNFYSLNHSLFLSMLFWVWIFGKHIERFSKKSNFCLIHFLLIF